MRKLILCLCITLLIFAGCGKQQTETNSSGADASEPFYNLYFPYYNDFEFSGEVSSGGSLYFDYVIKTNTAEVTIENTGEIPFICKLCYPDEPEQILASMTVGPGQIRSIHGLSDALRYSLWFSSESEGMIQATISG